MPECKQITINGHTFTHGDWVNTKIGSAQLSGLRISVVNTTRAYLLSNEEYLDGGHNIDKMGFRYAWAFQKKADGTLSDGVWSITPGCSKPKDQS